MSSPFALREVQCCYTAVTVLPHCCHTAAILLLHCCYAAVKLLLHCCDTAATLVQFGKVRFVKHLTLELPLARAVVPRGTLANLLLRDRNSHLSRCKIP
jgi:hypothetical protein